MRCCYTQHPKSTYSIQVKCKAMTKVIEKCAQKNGSPLFICDFSPPRGADLDYIENAKALNADFICTGYNPGKSVRVDSCTIAYTIKQNAGKEVIFNLSTRDMNKLALQSHLLGAAALGLENLVVIKGDKFSLKELSAVKGVDDFSPTGLMKAVKAMNQGTDFRGLRLKGTTDFCVGATIDLGKGLEGETSLAHAKALAGADFFLMQSVYDVAIVQRFLELYIRRYGREFSQPIFYGIQILKRDGIIFGDVPQQMRVDLEKGRDGSEIALDLIGSFVNNGLRTFYLIPPILRGGIRDYEAAQRVLGAFS